MVAQSQRFSSRISSVAGSAIEQPKKVVEEYPVSSMLVVFGVGLAVGVVLSQSLCDPILRAWQPEPSHSFTEKLGRTVYEAVSSVMPEAVSRRMSA